MKNLYCDKYFSIRCETDCPFCLTYFTNSDDYELPISCLNCDFYEGCSSCMFYGTEDCKYPTYYFDKDGGFKILKDGETIEKAK
ncbi:MAG: hypothetical protein J6T10_30610 [Methanobrevibacter sp.]|nr:hypothetical protein [Methanobrevibacter sp.]